MRRIIVNMNLRRALLRRFHGTFFEHGLRNLYQFLKWNVPSLFLSRNTKIEIAYDKETLNFAKQVVSENSVIVDIGANNGSIFSRLCELSPKGKHIAFEPIPFFAVYLKRKFSKSDIRQIALSSFRGKAQFYNTVESPALSSLDIRRIVKLGMKYRQIEVEQDTLDNQLESASAVDFIKVDVEGLELEVLKGSVKILENFHPAIVIEISDQTEKEIRNFLEALSYQVDYLLPEKRIKALARNFGSDPAEIGTAYIKAVPVLHNLKSK